MGFYSSTGPERSALPIRSAEQSQHARSPYGGRQSLACDDHLARPFLHPIAGRPCLHGYGYPALKATSASRTNVYSARYSGTLAASSVGHTREEEHL
jgi:hypothetical protein